MKSVLLLFFMTILFGWYASAQDEPLFPSPFTIPKSPNAASFERYGSTPVNLNSGQVSPAIPLYQFTTDNVNVPIGLTYSNTGLKVSDLPSWVGLGWDLQVGGVIAHNVKGRPDDTETGMFDYYSRQSVRRCFNSEMTSVERYYYLKSVYDGALDSEYDQFSFDILGRRGRFYINDKGACILQPESDLRISYSYDSVAHNLSSFVISDENGCQFIFDAEETSSSANSDAMLYSDYYNGTTGSSFFLTKIVTANGRQVSFEYADHSLRYFDYVQSFRSFDQNENVEKCKGFSDFISINVENVIGNKILKKIIWDDGRIEFIADSIRKDIALLPSTSSLPHLNKILVYNDKNEIVKRIDFGISYFGDNARLKLSKVEIVNPYDTTVRQSWNFSYVGEVGTFPSLARPNYSQDIWGYFNNESNVALPQLSLLPKFYGRSYYSFIPPNRVPTDAAKIGMLSEIKYPAGGTTKFEYEPNMAYFTNAQSVPPALQDYLPSNLVRRIIYDKTASAYSNANGGLYVEERINDSINIAIPSRLIVKVSTYNDDVAGFATAEGALQGVTCVDGGAGVYVVKCQTLNATFPVLVQEMTLDVQPGKIRPFLLASAVDGHIATVRIEITEVTETNLNNIQVRVGGFRISKMTDTTSGAEAVVRRYYYPVDTVNNVYNAHLRVSGNPITFTNRTVQPIPGDACLPCLPLITVNSFDITGTEGTHIEYPKVVEALGKDSSGGLRSHYFSPYVSIGGGNFPYANPFNFSWINGVEYRTDVFGKVNGGDTLLLKQNISNFTHIEDSLSYGNYSLKVGVSNYDVCMGYPSNLISEGNATYALQSFATEFVPNYTQKYNLSRGEVMERNYLGNGLSKDIIGVSEYLYSTKAITLPSVVAKLTSGALKHMRKIFYPVDYSQGNAFINSLCQSNMKNRPIEQVEILKYANGDEFVTGGVIITYKAGSNQPDKLYKLYTQIPIPISNFAFSTVDSNGIFNMDSRYVEYISYDKYGTYGTISEQTKYGNIKESFIWTNNNQYLSAYVHNSDSASIGYTSFETMDHGNWNYLDGNVVSNSIGLTGGNYYNINISNGEISKKVTNGKTYLVTYWRKGSITPFGIGGGTFLVKTGVTNSDGWTYQEHRVTANSTIISITGTGIIDEVRIYPVGATMETYSYEPLVGLTSKAGIRSNIEFYEYDGFGRLTVVRDLYHHIIKKYCYNFSGQPEVCDSFKSQAQTGNFTRNNCAIGGTGSTVFYNVAAGRFSSIVSQADANALAVAALNSEGQAYANTNGSCTFMCDNQSGNFTRSNCGPGYVGSTVTYSIAAGTYSSLVSKQDANNQAIAALNSGGQEYANTMGICEPVTIYAQAEYSGLYEDGNYTYGTVLLMFYSDAACTIPYSVSNLPVNYQQVRTDCGGGGEVTAIFSATCNGTSTSLGLQTLSVDDGFNCWNYAFSVSAGYGYLAK